MKNENIYLSVIIPCYNEESNIRLGALENVAHFLKKKDYSYEVVIVDDGSTDESKNLIREFLMDHENFRLVTNKHLGKAGTVIEGVYQAKGEFVLFSDLDQATPIQMIDKLLPYFEKGYDLVIGSRKGRRKGAPLTRRLMALGFMSIRNMILNLGIDDTQCGFKAFTATSAKRIFSRLQIYKQSHLAVGSTVTAGFDVELLFVAKTLGYKIAEVPVEWHYQDTRRVSPLKDSWEGFLDLIKIRYNQMNGHYR
jgi:glycosyltransferase involved in cell wall biosynthesis